MPVEQIRRAPDGYIDFEIHEAQEQALDSQKRFILVAAGWQAGKTSVLAPWLMQEIQRCGPGDYLVASPTYPLMQKKVLPEFLRLFQRIFRLGDFVAGKNIFTFSARGRKWLFKDTPWEGSDEPVQVFFGHAQKPDSLESATYKAAALDEADQADFRDESHEAILGRLSIHQGRVLYTTRPYRSGWLKRKVFDPWDEARRQGKDHPTIDVISFSSLANPAFPQAEWDRARAEMPSWRFTMKYEGKWTKPAGLIYDCFDSRPVPLGHTCPRWRLPDHWPRFLGLDFGNVNTAGIFFAQEPLTGKLWAYREYHPKRTMTAEQHVAALLEGEPSIPQCAGGSKQEQGWREAFCAAGLPVVEPAVVGADSVEVGIERAYSGFARNMIVVFDDLTSFIEQLNTYSREVDEVGEPTDAIEEKATYHVLDAFRYISTWLFAPAEDPTDDESRFERV